MTADGTVKYATLAAAHLIAPLRKPQRDLAGARPHSKIHYKLYGPEMADLYKRELINEKVDIWALAVSCTPLRFSFIRSRTKDLFIINGAYKVPANHRYSEHMVRLLKILHRET